MRSRNSLSTFGRLALTSSIVVGIAATTFNNLLRSAVTISSAWSRSPWRLATPERALQLNPPRHVRRAPRSLIRSAGPPLPLPAFHSRLSKEWDAAGAAFSPAVARRRAVEHLLGPLDLPETEKRTEPPLAGISPDHHVRRKLTRVVNRLQVDHTLSRPELKDGLAVCRKAYERLRTSNLTRYYSRGAVGGHSVRKPGNVGGTGC